MPDPTFACPPALPAASPAGLHTPCGPARGLPAGSRRRFAAGAGAFALGAPWLSPARAAGDAPEPFTFTDLRQAETALTTLGPAPAPRDGDAAMGWAPMLVHCAQSIEFSMSGFPEPKSALFQATAGRLAFRAFSVRGRMSHDLRAPIPGAPALDPAIAAEAALARLQAAIGAFRTWSGPLRPHFAYGALDRADYERAHAMHLAEHLSAFRRAG